MISELKESDAAVLGASALGWEAKYHYEAPVASAAADSSTTVIPVEPEK